MDGLFSVTKIIIYIFLNFTCHKFTFYNEIVKYLDSIIEIPKQMLHYYYILFRSKSSRRDESPHCDGPDRQRRNNQRKTNSSPASVKKLQPKTKQSKSSPANKVPDANNKGRLKTNVNIFPSVSTFYFQALRGILHRRQQP